MRLLLVTPIASVCVCLVVCLSLAGIGTALGSDHDDTPPLKSLQRHDARITDLYAFTRGSDLIIALCSDPAIPQGIISYIYPKDLTFEINIDNSTKVTFDNPSDLAVFGGTILEPESMRADIQFRISFKQCSPRLQVKGISREDARSITHFIGLRDDPFIRGPRIGKNIAAIVLKIPLHLVSGPRSTLLIWATSRIAEIDMPQLDLAGRSLRSQLPENMALNFFPPRYHKLLFEVPPDVIIYDLSRPALFPNGRELNDDVVDLVADPRILETDAPFPSSNDVPFLDRFPFLAPPRL